MKMAIPPKTIMDNQNLECIKDLIDEGHEMTDINSAGYFTNQFIYPKTDHYGIMRTCEQCGHKYKDEESQKRYREEANKYHAEDVRLHDLFKASLIYAYDLDPRREKTQKAFNMAWDKGHANGRYEVIQKFDELVELIK